MKPSLSIPSSFSGLHEYQSSCALLANELRWCDTFEPERLKVLAQKIVDRIDSALEAGNCPRCLNRLPAPPEYPAGSRITPCRCIPICGRCGSDEAVQSFRFGGISPMEGWPLTKASITRRENIFAKETTTSTAIVSGDRLIDDEGSHEIRFREHPGGWAEYQEEGKR